jgi:broad specificity phosphatase PhoE
MKLVLVRHGQTEWNLLHRTQGQCDSPLTGKGLLQAENAGRALAGLGVDAFYCSDSGRAVHTADAIRQVNPALPAAVPDPRLRELRFGEWEGLRHEEIVERYADLYAVYHDDPASFRAPGGESFGEQQERFCRFLADLPVDGTGTVLVVSHAGLIRVALLTLSGRTIAQMRSIPSIPEASISVAECRQGSWTILQSCDTRHLPG